MKLPTLNVDLKLNSKNFKRDMAAVGKGAAGVVGLGGQKAGLGNAIGSAVGSGLGIGGLGQAGTALQAVAIPFKLVMGTATKIMDTFNSATRNGSAVMRDFNDMVDTRESGLNVISASRLAAGEEKMKSDEASSGGDLWDTFVGAGLNTEGQKGGLMGELYAWAKEAKESVKFAVATAGGLAGGKGMEASLREGMIATSSSSAGANSYATKEELVMQNKQFTQANKYIREITS
jgi:hypothetical protein